MVQGLALGEDFVYRQFDQPVRASSRPTASGTRPARDVVGYSNGRNQTISDLETPDGATRRYLGFTTTVSKREGRMKLQAAYTWSRLRRHRR